MVLDRWSLIHGQLICQIVHRRAPTVIFLLPFSWSKFQETPSRKILENVRLTPSKGSDRQRGKKSRVHVPGDEEEPSWSSALGQHDCMTPLFVTLTLGGAVVVEKFSEFFWSQQISRENHWVVAGISPHVALSICHRQLLLLFFFWDCQLLLLGGLFSTTKKSAMPSWQPTNDLFRKKEAICLF